MCCLLDLTPANKELFGDLKDEGSLGGTGWEVIKFSIQRGGGIGRKQDCKPGLEEERLWPVQDSETSRKVQGKVKLPSVEENQDREYLNKLVTCKAMVLVWYVLRELIVGGLS